MKLKLTALERFAVLSLLPEKGNYLTLKALRELKESLAFEEDEQKEYGIALTPDGRATIGDTLLACEKEIPETIYATLREALKKLESEAALTTDTSSLYEKIVLEMK